MGLLRGCAAAPLVGDGIVDDADGLMAATDRVVVDDEDEDDDAVVVGRVGSTRDGLGWARVLLAPTPLPPPLPPTPPPLAPPSTTSTTTCQSPALAR